MMKTTMLILVLLGLSTIPVGAQQTAAIAQMVDVHNEPLGTVQLREATRQGVFIEIELNGLPPGELAFHIHETGRCAPDFDAAGGHFNPYGNMHGLLHPEGSHAGDLLNIRVPSSGQISTERLATGVTLQPGAAATLFDEDGSALVIHAGPDDYVSQPSGAAGDPIACGVIRR
jgi:superoxide dismutase, Cu-Zn family